MDIFNSNGPPKMRKYQGRSKYWNLSTAQPEYVASNFQDNDLKKYSQTAWSELVF